MQRVRDAAFWAMILFVVAVMIVVGLVSSGGLTTGAPGVQSQSEPGAVESSSAQEPHLPSTSAKSPLGLEGIGDMEVEHVLQWKGQTGEKSG